MSWVIDREEWLELYSWIKKELPGLNFERDQYSAEVLSALLEEHEGTIELEGLLEAISGYEVAVVVGCSEALERDAEYLKQALGSNKKVLVAAANGATAVLLSRGIIPGLVTTDLDGDLAAISRSAGLGSVVVVHAHGDNVDRLPGVRAVKGRIVGSTQAEPRPHVYNFGGFTDGDRAAFILYHAGYRKIHLLGFDFEKPSQCPGKARLNPEVKKRKLEVARRLVEFLQSRGVEVVHGLVDW